MQPLYWYFQFFSIILSCLKSKILFIAIYLVKIIQFFAITNYYTEPSQLFRGVSATTKHSTYTSLILSSVLSHFDVINVKLLPKSIPISHQKKNEVRKTQTHMETTRKTIEIGVSFDHLHYIFIIMIFIGPHTCSNYSN